MHSLIKGNVSVRGSVNGEDLSGSVSITIDPNTGIIDGNLLIESLPRDFAVIAASGQSWVCNSNSGGGATLVASARSLLTLSNFNYDLERRNEFPDGSAIDMHFKVRRTSEDSIEVLGEWNGNYGLPIDIVSMKAPIVEKMNILEAGLVESEYTYSIFDSSGQQYNVRTPSKYRYEPSSEVTEKTDQKRIMFFAIGEIEKNRKYRLISQSTIITSESIGFLGIDDISFGLPVKFG